MTASDAEDLEPVFRFIEATKGRDMTEMRQMATALAEIETGDPTPLPGALMRADLPGVTLPDPTGKILMPLYEGENEPPAGKFTDLLWLPASHTSSYVGQRQYRRLAKKVRRLMTSHVLHWMCFASLIYVLVVKW